jgi:hypothetical protein
MKIDSSHPSLVPLGSTSSSQIHYTLSIDGLPDVNIMKIANPPNCLVTPAVVVHSPHPRTPSLQADEATLIEEKYTLQNHAYSKVGVKLGTYSRSLVRSTRRPKGEKLGSARCTAVHTLGFDNCDNNDGDNNGKGPHKRVCR